MPTDASHRGPRDFLDSAISVWGEMHTRLADGLPSVRRKALATAKSESEVVWVEEYLNGQLEMLKSAYDLLKGLDAATAHCSDGTTAVMIAEITGGYALHAYHVMMRQASGEGATADRQSAALKEYQEIASELVGELRKDSATAVEIAKRHAELAKTRASVHQQPSVPVMHSTEHLPAELKEAQDRLQASLRVLEELKTRVSGIYDAGPLITEWSMRVVKEITIPSLEQVTKGNFERIANRYRAYRRLAEFLPGIVGTSVEVVSDTKGLSSAVGLLGSFLSKEIFSEPLRQSELARRESAETIAAQVLPQFLIPYAACMLAHVRLGIASEAEAIRKLKAGVN